jgi:hypothetical protein
MAGKAKGPSWAPSTYKQSSGLFDDVDSVIQSYRYTGDETPDGYTAKDGTIPMFLVVEHQIDGVEGVNTDWFSLGGKSRDCFSIGDDGLTLVPLFEGAQINAKAKAAGFISSFITAGAPESLFENEDFSLPIAGWGVHLQRVPDTSDFAKSKTDSKYPPTVLAVTSFSDETKKAWSGGKKAAAAKAAPAAAPKAGKPAAKPAAAPVADDTDLNAIAQQTVIDVLAANGNTQVRSKMIVPVSKAIASLDAAIKDEVRKLALSAEFLATEGLGWTYDAKSQTVTLE